MGEAYQLFFQGTSRPDFNPISKFLSLVVFSFFIRWRLIIAEWV
jgi:hypothetical protein